MHCNIFLPKAEIFDHIRIVEKFMVVYQNLLSAAPHVTGTQLVPYKCLFFFFILLQVVYLKYTIGISHGIGNTHSFVHIIIYRLLIFTYEMASLFCKEEIIIIIFLISTGS